MEFTSRSLRSLTESDTDEDNTEEIFENKLDVKIVDISTDSLISTETEVASSIKSEFVEEEYSEFTTKDLLTPAKAEHFSHINIDEDSKMFQQVLLNQEMVQIYELPEEKPQIFRLSPEGGPVQSIPPEGGPVQSNPAQSEIFIRLWSQVILNLCLSFSSKYNDAILDFARSTNFFRKMIIGALTQD